MKRQIAFITGLVSIATFAGYNPEWGFALNITIKDARITPGILLQMCSNSPLYFTLPDGNRDYVKTVIFNISQRKTGNYDVDYEIISHNDKRTIQTKGTKKEVVEHILHKTFPQVLTSNGEHQWYNLRSLEKSETARLALQKSVDLINGFLPKTTQLSFDEKDFSAIPFNDWRSWFSPSSWKNYWAWRRVTNKNP
jgi:hypothetical protein